MSAFVCGYETLCRVIYPMLESNLSIHLPSMTEQAGLDSPEWLYKDDVAYYIAAEFHVANNAAVYGRYEGRMGEKDIDLEATAKEIAAHYEKDFKPGDIGGIIKVITDKETPSLVQSYKSLQCLLYQMAEEPVYGTPIYRFAEALKSFYADELIRKTPSYDAADWG